ncbi:hypothetical protein Nepgr_017893 [Nepenthes gracilis]|uniref:J domain-containing protein n=1 Tax=Nepenthes gracilis TaxID=150966 RepID=A0AAD3ST47_NEPGR|nr:hypothetical protein Nepgr_017893 [Nepenthes gracilis]
MAGGEERKGSDFYAVLGLDKECTATELRSAYKKLAMKWHPDRCSASGSIKFVEESKKKFQAVQEAYSVLSDENKRFLYDVGVYDTDDDENNNGMGEFLNEMATMMSQTKPSSGNEEENFEQLKELFEQMFQGDVEEFSSISGTSTTSFSSSYASCPESSNTSNKRNSSEMYSAEYGVESSTFDARFQSFCFGADHSGDPRRGTGTRKGKSEGASGRRRNGRKQKISCSQDVSSNY